VITGKVTDADGRPIVEEQIFFSSIGRDRGLSYLRTVRTDDRGVYRAFAIPPGRYTVSAGRDSVSSFGRTEGGPQRTYHPSAANPAEATPIQVNEGSEATNVDIRLGRQLGRFTAHGRIIDGDASTPLPNARIGILLFFNVGGSTSRAAAESTKDGVFKIENLAPGKYAVYFDSDSERFSETVRFEVTDQDIDGLLIKTSKGASVSGVVVVEGTHDPKPNLAGAPIFAFLSNEAYGRPTHSTKINPDGSFRLNALPAGRLSLALPRRADRLQLMRIERDGVVSRNSIEVKEREQITGVRLIASVANGTIRGVLKFPEGFQLPASARVVVAVRRIEDPTAPNSPAEADARGQFRIQNLAPGTYEFSVGILGGPDDQRWRIPRPVETVVVTNGAIADVTVTLQMPRTGPTGP
ncbi:MAG TPA: carboxypeptidase-like regulatory domain-containing protein, partial [Pyrinomonadaceae bacterium]|nr:carboxypeptidase-like regulatory domain-containing protein [Pyrinomonadaceae bacterium]